MKIADLNTMQPKPQFGMAIKADKLAKHNLQKLITNDYDLFKLNKMIDSQKNNNTVDVILTMTSPHQDAVGTKLVAKAGNKKFIQNVFSSPIKTIEKAVKYASSLRDKELTLEASKDGIRPLLDKIEDCHGFII